MGNGVSTDILEKWHNAWSLSRELPLPTKFKSGYKVDVGYEKQKARYVFAELNDDIIQLSETIHENWIFLKVCASPAEIKNKIAERWVIQPQGYIMSCFSPMNIPNVSLPNGYKIVFESYESTTMVNIVGYDGELASTGRVVIIDELAVFDRILTYDKHKRKGLATFLIKELERIALSKDVHQNILVATEQGKLLYESLGWKTDSLYTSVVIPL